MTDKDVIEKVCNIFGSSCFAWQRPGETKSGALYKKVYMTSLRGVRALEWMKILHPLMSERRQTQIDQAMASYDPDKFKNMSRPNKVIGEKEIEKIIQMRHENLNFREIAKKFGVSRRTIERVIKSKT